MKKLSILVGIFVLSACGGDGDSSSGGSGSNNPYAGNYIGTANIGITGAGGSTSDSDQVILSVTDNGQVLIETFSDTTGTSCTGVNPVYLSGNSFSYTDQYSCSIPGVGNCSFSESGSGSISGTTASAKGNATANCPGGTLAMTFKFTGKKQ